MESQNQSARRPDPEEAKTPSDIPQFLVNIYKFSASFIGDVINLKKGVNPVETVEEIRKKNNISGANAWMLMCSIMIASIGLSQNSQAVIIGAMLISPLMSPILGIGVSVGINDIHTLRKSLSHFLVAILIALFTSTVYFYFMPLDVITPEIEARTKPTFLDIFIAIFGGLAGIISIARKDISTTLPGVAIATALMPPLCVTGYGLAQGNIDIASRSFYLFFLNSFFVALATYAIVRYLNFPYKKFVERAVKRKNMLYVGLFSLAVVIPSFFIFRSVLKDLRQNVTLQAFETSCLGDKGIYLDSYHHDKTANILYLKVYSDTIDPADQDIYEKCLHNLGMQNTSIVIIPTSDVQLDDVKLMEADIAKISSQLKEVNRLKVEREELVKSLEGSNIDTTYFNDIRKELIILFPQISEIGFAKIHTSDFDTVYYYLPTILVHWKPRTRIPANANDQIRDFVKERTDAEEVRVIEF